MVNIGIFGHSIAFRKPNEHFSWITKLEQHFLAKTINYSTSNCSEERILFNLKKAKDLDLAIIFHAKPRYMYVPGWTRDVDSLDKNTLEIKAGFDLKKALQKEYEISDEELENIPKKDLTYMLERFLKIPDNPIFNVISSIDGVKAKQIMDEWNNTSDKNVANFLDKFIQSCNERVNFYSELVNCLLLNKKYMFHVDLQNNRHQGALILIDQYLQAKQIPAVHCIITKHSVPEWFSFQSGVVDYEIANYQNFYRESSYKSSNYTSEKGNKVLFEKMLELIRAARSRVELR